MTQRLSAPIFRPFLRFINIIAIVSVTSSCSRQSDEDLKMVIRYPSTYGQEMTDMWRAEYVIRELKPQEWRVLQVEDIVQLERAALLLESASQPHVVTEHTLFDSAGPEPLGLHVMGDLLTGSFVSLRDAAAAVEVSAPAPQTEGVCWPIPKKSNESWAVLLPENNDGQ